MENLDILLMLEHSSITVLHPQNILLSSEGEEVCNQKQVLLQKYPELLQENMFREQTFLVTFTWVMGEDGRLHIEKHKVAVL